MSGRRHRKNVPAASPPGLPWLAGIILAVYVVSELPSPLNYLANLGILYFLLKKVC